MRVLLCVYFAATVWKADMKSCAQAQLQLHYEEVQISTIMILILTMLSRVKVGAGGPLTLLMLVGLLIPLKQECSINSQWKPNHEGTRTNAPLIH